MFVCVFYVCTVCAWCLEEAEESLELLSYCLGAGSSARAGSTLNCWSSFLPTSPCDFCFKAILFHLLFFLILCYIKFSFILLCILFEQNNVSHDIFIWIYKVILKLALFIKKAEYVILLKFSLWGILMKGYTSSSFLIPQVFKIIKAT